MKTHTLARSTNRCRPDWQIYIACFVAWFIAAITLSITVLGEDLAEKPKGDPSVFPVETYKPTKGETIPSFAFQRYYTKDKYGRTITFYLSRRKPEFADKKLPLAVCIQGSGGQSVFVEHKGAFGTSGPASIIARDFRTKASILVVEKPGIEFLFQPKRPGSSLESPNEFNREFSLSRWVEAIHAAIEATSQLPIVDTSKVLALGHSEGGQVACQVAVENPRVTHVANMAGGGATQLYDLICFAQSGDMYDPNATPKQRLKALMQDWKNVLADPTATDKFVLGHTHLRWSSFLESSPVEAILKTKAKVFLAQGTADVNTLPASTDVMYAELLARGRDVTYERINGAGHAFMKPDDKTGNGWTKTNGKAMDWFLKTE